MRNQLGVLWVVIRGMDADDENGGSRQVGIYEDFIFIFQGLSTRSSRVPLSLCGVQEVSLSMDRCGGVLRT